MKCFKCGSLINKNERYVKLSTLDNEKIIEEVNFHIVCWGKYNDQRVSERLKELYNKGIGLLNK